MCSQSLKTAERRDCNQVMFVLSLSLKFPLIIFIHPFKALLYEAHEGKPLHWWDFSSHDLFKIQRCFIHCETLIRSSSGLF